jgi:two-component system cell cycle sensor histidine kinase/response regulator CckA
MEILARLRRVIRAPVFEEERDAAAASLLNSVLWMTIVGSASYEVFQLVVGVDAIRLLAVGFVFGTGLGALVALRRKQLRFAARTTLSLIFGIACLSIWLAGHIEAPGTSTFVVLILMSAMAIDWRSAMAWTLASIAALSVFALAETNGWMLPVEAPRPLGELWFIYAIHLVAAGWLVGHSAFAFRGALGLLGKRSMALRDSEARHAELVAQSPDVIVALDDTGTVVECSPAIESMFGYRVSEVVGRSFSQVGVLESDSLVRTMDNFHTLLSGEAAELLEARVIHRDGTTRWVEANTRVVHRSDDGSSRLFLVIRDTTARHEAEQQRASLERQLMEARRLEALGRMAGGVAHDFNNLLMAILTNTELLAAGSHVPAQQLVDEIRVAAEGGADLTRQLLAFSGRQAPKADQVDVGASIAKLDGLLRRLLPPHVKLDVRCSEELGLARSDPAQFEQVILNLFMNAHQAMPEAGTLTIEISNEQVTETDCAGYPGALPGPHVRLAVTDEGRGMDEETARRIFEPFFSAREEGTGLGLATVHGIVTRVGGHIRVHSKPGAGTTFEVFLPVAQGDSVARETAAEVASMPNEGVVVLLVDDDRRILSGLSTALELRGFRVLAADSAESAIEISRAEAGRIQVLVTDVRMPGVSGPELARKLTSERPDLKVIITSGYMPEDLARGGVHFLDKPFSSAQLRERIAEVLQDA